MYIFIGVGMGIICALGICSAIECEKLKDKNKVLEEYIKQLREEYKLEKELNEVGLILAQIIDNKVPEEYKEYGTVIPESVKWYSSFSVGDLRHKYIIKFETER